MNWLAAVVIALAVTTPTAAIPPCHTARRVRPGWDGSELLYVINDGDSKLRFIAAPRSRHLSPL